MGRDWMSRRLPATPAAVEDLSRCFERPIADPIGGLPDWGSSPYFGPVTPMAPPSPGAPLPEPRLTASKRLGPCRSEFDPGRFVLAPVFCHPVRIFRGCSVPTRPPGFRLEASRDKPVVHFGPARCGWGEHCRIELIVRCSTWRDGRDAADGEGQLGTATADEFRRNLRHPRERGSARSPVLVPSNRCCPQHRSHGNDERRDVLLVAAARLPKQGVVRGGPKCSCAWRRHGTRAAKPVN